MFIKELAKGEQQSFTRRIQNRKLTENDCCSEEDLVVSGKGIVLDENSQYRPKIVRAKTLEELGDLLGNNSNQKQPREARVLAGRQLQRDMLRRKAQKVRVSPSEVLRPKFQREPIIRSNAGDDADSDAAFAHAAIKAMVGGAISVAEARELGLAKQIEGLIAYIDIRQWLWPNITVQSGSTLTIRGPGVHTIQAYTLTVEANASIVINNAHVTIDCVRLNVL